MKKQALFMVVFLAAVGLLAGFTASGAFANAANLAPCGVGWAATARRAPPRC